MTRPVLPPASVSASVSSHHAAVSDGPVTDPSGVRTVVALGAVPPHLPDWARGPRLAVRALIVYDARLLLVNAWPEGHSDLWCAPGGGVEIGQSLPDALRREVAEECGIEIAVGAPALVNEFHDPVRGFHQVEVFFRCTVASAALPDIWHDPAGVVTHRRFFNRDEMRAVRFKPDSLANAAWGAGVIYDPLEEILR